MSFSMNNTKAELLGRLEVLEAAAQHLARERDKARAEADRQLAAYAGAIAREERTGVRVYVAGSSEGTPTCVYAPDTDGGLAVAMYLHAGEIIGVDVTRETEFVTRAGLVPAVDE